MPGGFGVMVRYTGLGSGFLCFFGGFLTKTPFWGFFGVFKKARAGRGFLGWGWVGFGFLGRGF